MFKVKIKKVHQKYAKLFPLGSIVTVRRYDNNGVKLQALSEVNNTWYSAQDMCRCFSNTCSYGDIFIRVEEKVKLSIEKRIEIAEASLLRWQNALDMGCDYKHYSKLVEITKDQINELKSELC